MSPIPLPRRVDRLAAAPRASSLAVLVLSPTVVLTLLAMADPEVFTNLRRDPDALANGEVWRLLSPVLVQQDALQPNGGWRALAVFALVAAVLAVVQGAFGARRTLALYGIGALVGHGVGQWWQPHGSGCSVAGCGVLGGVAAWLLPARPLQVKVGAAVVLALALVATLFEDIHGPPLLAGAVAAVWLSRQVPLPAPLRGE